MKKIVAAAFVGLTLAGAAFAEISFSYTGKNYFKSSAGNLDYDSRTDCMSLSISSKSAGAVVDFDTDAGELVQDEYYGWMTFGLPAGNLQITAGSWNGRYADRVKSDAGDLDSSDFELYKPGVINGLGGKDSDNLTQGKMAMTAAYTNTDLLPGTLMVKLALVKGTWDPEAKTATTAKEDGDVDDSDLILSSGFAGEVAFRAENLINANIAFRWLEKKSFSIAGFVSPLMFEKVRATVGFTFASVNNYEKYNSADGKTSDWADGATEFALDLRLRYQITEKLAVTTMHNLSSYADLPSGDVVEKAREYGDNTLVLWDMINLTYKPEDKITVGYTLNAVFSGLDSDHTFTGADLITTPYIRIDANSNVAVTAGARIAVNGLNPEIDGHETMDVTVPVLFSFSL